MASSLEQLKKFTTVVADTGDFESISKYKPTDATTNPSLLLAASKMPQYKHLIEKAVQYGKANGSTLEEQVTEAMDKIVSPTILNCVIETYSGESFALGFI